MKYLLLLLVSLDAFCAPNKLKGVAEIEQILGERLLEAPLTFSLPLLTPTFDSRSFLFLMGTYSESGGNFVNADPNPVNTSLWKIYSKIIAEEIAGNCGFDPEKKQLFIYNRSFLALLQPLCQWPNSQNLLPLWTALMSYDAPEEEYQAWRDFFLSSDYAKAPASKALPAMIMAILYDPHFLLRK